VDAGRRYSPAIATVLHVAPHPDDEAIGAPATLLALREAGHRVINLACGLGEPGQQERRREEAEESCARAGFELVLHDPPLHLGPTGERQPALRELAAAIEDLVRAHGVTLVVGPSPHDGHREHEVVGAAARDALESLGTDAPRLWLWGLWADLPWPTLYYGFGELRLEQVVHVLEAHDGELRRNDYRVLIRGRAAANRCLGSERVFGFGTAMRPEPYAELLMEVALRDDEWWGNGARELAPDEPFREPPGEGRGRAQPVGWWMQARSFAEVIEDLSLS
jgi:LmbE family N-acetylglucosaminyl deacetylase